MAPDRILIGQIGTKHTHAAGKYRTICKFGEDYEVVGIVEDDEEQRLKMEATGAYQGANWLTEEQLLNVPGLRAVAVETDVPELVPAAQRCLEAGLHVHLDKPAGPSMSACRRMHSTADKGRLTIQMGYMFRYNPGFVFLFQAVDEERLGTITELNSMIGKYATNSLRLQMARFSGGGMFELGCHVIDQMVTVLGPPQGVATFSFHSHPEKDDLADNQLAVFRYPKAVATIRCNHIDPHGQMGRRKFEVIGEKGVIEITKLEPPNARISFRRPVVGYKRGYQPVELTLLKGRYDGDFIDLARVIRGEKELRWNSAHDLAVHEAILRASEMKVD